MNLWERLKFAIASFRAAGGIDLPESGRSSEETINGALSAYLGFFGAVSPIIDFEMLKTLKCFWLYNPDFSQYVANIVNLGNPGHQLSIEARTDAVVDKAVDRLNDAAARIYRHGVGVDGLLNQYITSVAWSGAISSEDVVNLASGRVEKVVLVPVEQIRFRYNKETDEYDPYQSTHGIGRRTMARDAFGLIPLNRETYRYYALQTVENSPYAKPPGTAAVEAILEGQKPLMDNMRFIAQKFGLLGLVTASLALPPKKPGETDDEYRNRSQNYLKTVAKTLEANFHKGLLATFADQKLQTLKIAEGAQGLYDVNRISEEQVFSGLAAMPGFHGRTDSTTETFADVVYYLLTAQVQNIQRIVKRRQERTYMLDLRLGGIDVDQVSLSFHKAHSRNAKAEAETDEILLRTMMSKVEKGLITPDEGAQEIGYETWADVELIMNGRNFGATADEKKSLSRNHSTRTLDLSFDRRSQRYRYLPETIEVRSELQDPADNVVPMTRKKKASAN
jgi:hypothetical protein